ncbi:hypothetical protein EYR41_009366 [Orbilia oligospora]|uniref:Uncharacterized protein n=1 Tax=Orbilia oligospora TaxID=2813651 RepID=A0A8H2DRF3_ORBOL|nr:hypothetical protein EYR41_009366 [Orbilia oligospora]
MEQGRDDDDIRDVEDGDGSEMMMIMMEEEGEEEEKGDGDEMKSWISNRQKDVDLSDLDNIVGLYHDINSINDITCLKN